MDKPIICHPDFWKDKLIPQFLSFEGLDEFIRKRVHFIRVFPLVYKTVFEDLSKSKGAYDDASFGDLYRRFNLIKGIFQGVNNKDDEVGSTAGLLRQFAPGESADPRDYGIVSPTIWDVDFPRPGDKKHPFSDSEIGPENRERLFNLLKAIQGTPDGWFLTNPSVLDELPFRIGNSLLSPLLFALNPREYPITNQAVKDAISWLKGEDTADEQSFILPKFPIPQGMKDYMDYAGSIKSLSQEFVQLTAREDLDKKAGLGFLDAFFWWLQSHFAKKRVWVVAPCDSKAKDFDQRWQDCLENHFIAVGWSEIGDLSQVTKKNELKGLYSKAFPKVVKGEKAQNCSMLWQLAKDVKKGDLVIARQGRNKAIGVGTVSQEYRFEPNKKEFKHVVGVNWDEDFTPRKASNQFGMQAVHEVTHLTYEEILQASEIDGTNGPVLGDPPPDVLAVSRLISEYRNIILYGPPGTGKTYLVREAARYWLAGANKISEEEAGKQYLSFVQFHPSYGYEDFIRGLTATTDTEGRLHYLYRDGLFLETCLKAQHAGNKEQFVLIIDEINRGDIPRIFGELMYLLEYRGSKYQLNLQYPDKDGNRSFYVPENLHVIGTMNTADRSIALLDTALRRRFQFHEIMPDSGKITSVIPVGESDEKCEPRTILENINERIRDQGLREKQIGHSYFMQDGTAIDDLGVLMGRFNGQILPLLQEYFFDDIEALNTVVGSKFVNLKTGAIVRHTDQDAFWEALKVLLKENPKGSPI
jgi:hypothetical protein